MKIYNPFGAPVYYEETVASTMDISRRFASAGEPYGTVIVAGFQETGRGRIKGRQWEMERGNGLPFTIYLCFPALEKIPPALTLRTGIAVSLAVEEFAPSLRGIVSVKWPNDVLIGNKKTAGILCEAEGGNVHVGIGINTSQKRFPAHLQEKATAVALAANINMTAPLRYMLLENVLLQLFRELKPENNDTWKSRLEQRLYKKNEKVIFVEGAAGSNNKITGTLIGIGDNGELKIIPEGKSIPCSFFAGELVQE